jgi:predicted metalloprotease with PDZ domain
MHVQGATDRSELRLPVWTPGSYMVREFARHVQDFRAADEHSGPLEWSKTRKDTWSVEGSPSGLLTAEFDVYANDLTVRTSHVDRSHAFLNPSNLLPYVTDRADEPLLVVVQSPESWKIATGLPPSAEDPAAFVAHDYDELLDSPLHLGTDPQYDFEVDGVPHAIATWGRGNLEPERLVGDAARIIRTQRSLFGGLPYERYVFILLLTDGAGGGLEHRNSSALMIPRFRFRAGRPYERSLSLVAHEFFHTWNVKRIHPAALGPFDYGAENYTRLLWAMEGITDYYTWLTLRRTGLVTVERYLEILGEQMSEQAETPGRHLQSLEEASFDAWIKYYRPDEHSVNSSISYYRKGALASLLLDLEMRRRSRGQRTLDDLMRLLWERYGQTGTGIPEDGYERTVAELVPGDWGGFFDRVIRGRGDLEYDAALGAVGVEVEWHTDPQASHVWLGLQTRSDAGRLKVTSVLSSGPAWEAGLAAGDEILALDGYRVDEASLGDRLRDYQPGDTVKVAVFHRDELMQIPITLTARPASRATLRRSRRPSVLQRTLFDDWVREQPAEAR